MKDIWFRQARLGDVIGHVACSEQTAESLSREGFAVCSSRSDQGRAILAAFESNEVAIRHLRRRVEDALRKTATTEDIIRLAVDMGINTHIV